MKEVICKGYVSYNSNCITHGKRKLYRYWKDQSGFGEKGWLGEQGHYQDNETMPHDTLMVGTWHCHTCQNPQDYTITQSEL